MDSIFNVRIVDVKQDIYECLLNCNLRGLQKNVKWLAEINHGLVDPMDHRSTQPITELHTKQVLQQPMELPLTKSRTTTINSTNTTAAAGTSGNSNNKQSAAVQIIASELDAYYLAKSYYDCREYDRAAYFTRNCISSVPKFLHYYCQYMAKEKKRLDNLTDTANLSHSGNLKDLTDLLNSLKSMYQTQRTTMDAYMLYLYGVVLKKLDLTELAIQIFVECVTEEPCLWSAWIEMAPLITDRTKLEALRLPVHWMNNIFMAHSLIELFFNDEGLRMFNDLQTVGFTNCVYITSQMAIAYHNKRNVDKAIQIFQTLQEVDPYRLDNLDIFSNLLFVKELKKEMAFLAHKAVEINKYRPETCCVIGNYYSIRNEHQKAVTYFQRALKLDPHYLSAWTLMGHEFMEMKNTNAAIQSYRKAVEVSRRDYRAWYGLGQAYEILKMPFYSLYYYKIAQHLRPYDSRMLVALGETYEKLDKNGNALKCYQKACNVGDIEGIALLRLADLFKKIGDIENAVPAYLNFCSDDRAAVDKMSLCRAFITLGNYYESVGKYDQATHFAYRCLEYDDTKSEARSLLKTIENNRGQIRPKSATLSKATGTGDGTTNSSTGTSTAGGVVNSNEPLDGATDNTVAGGGGGGGGNIVGSSSGGVGVPSSSPTTVDCNEVSMDESDVELPSSVDDSIMITDSSSQLPL